MARSCFAQKVAKLASTVDLAFLEKYQNPVVALCGTILFCSKISKLAKPPFLLFSQKSKTTTLAQKLGFGVFLENITTSCVTMQRYLVFPKKCKN